MTLRTYCRAFLALWIGLVASATDGQEIPDLATTARFAASCQNPDGGFGPNPGRPSALGSTTAGVRVLLYSGGSVPDVLGAIRYIRSCYDPSSGGFASTPGGKVDVGTTASGLMSMAEMKVADPAIIEAAVVYLAKTAKTFPEIRIAIAGLEAVGKKSDIFPEWEKVVRSNRNADGTWGEGATRAFDTGGSAAALLRMEADPGDREAITRAILSGQRPDGGWQSETDGDSNLGASYRVVRCLYMLGERPDASRLRGFIASCRDASGAYADRPGGAAALGGTYMATILLKWCNLLEGLPPYQETAGFRPLFDGKSLAGWEGDEDVWSARDGLIVGRSEAGLQHNNFLTTKERFGDFSLRLHFRLKDGQGNSGVQFRTERLPGQEVSGYQADIGEQFWGCLYDESRRNKILGQASEEALKAARPESWNQYEIRAMGNKIRLALNGKESVLYEEQDAGIPRDGILALQVHSGGPIETAFRDIQIQPLPIPSDSAADGHGFYLRKLRSGDGRIYTVYLPEGYDRVKQYPIVLFLHGSGERGTDGVVPSQVGLGPQLLAKPGDYRFIAVFPQARESWAGDGPDAAAALAALDEAMGDFEVNPFQVYLTGISMGGRGSWEIAAKNRGLFAAVVAVCGVSRELAANDLRGIPAWAIVGDEDRAELVQGLRKLAGELGDQVRYTEYRGVGHNSWDRAYSDPEVFRWLHSHYRTSK